MCKESVNIKIGDYDKANEWKQELTPEQQEKVAKTEQNHFWLGTLCGAIATGLLAALLRK